MRTSFFLIYARRLSHSWSLCIVIALILVQFPLLAHPFADLRDSCRPFFFFFPSFSLIQAARDISLFFFPFLYVGSCFAYCSNTYHTDDHTRDDYRSNSSCIAAVRIISIYPLQNRR